MREFPENTLIAVQSAVNAGARYVEFDIQFSADCVPRVFHDHDLQRLTQAPGKITETTEQSLDQLTVRHAGRLDQKIPRLTEMIELLNQSPHTTAFVEIKRQSIDAFGLEITVDSTVNALAMAKFPWVIISFREDAIDYAKRAHSCLTGWVLSSHGVDSRLRAEQLRADYLFCNVTRLSGEDDDYWPGNWQWVIYDIMNLQQAEVLIQRGADLIETGAILRMLRNLRELQENQTLF